MNEGGTAWCAGISEQRRRPLIHAEEAILRARLDQAKRLDRRWLQVKRGAVIASAAGLPLFWISAPPAKHWIGVPLLYLCMLTAPVAVLGALIEVIVGWSPVLRAVFVLAFAAAGAGVTLGQGSAISPALLGPAVLAIYFVGMFMAFMRAWELRKMTRLIPQLEADLDEAVAIEFEGVPPKEEPVPEALKRQRVRFAPEQRVSFAALPRSGVLIGVEGRVVDSYGAFQAAWDALEITITAEARGLEIPLYQSAETELAQRHASRDELDELRKHRERLLRRAGLGFLGVSYFAAQIARLGEVMLAGKIKAELSGSGWVIALGCGAFFALRMLMLRADLGTALASGKILLVRVPGAAPEAAANTETLMGTRVLWRENGEPAAWRRQRF